MKLNLVRRRFPTPSQTRLTRRERADNVRDAFEQVAGTGLDGDRCIVVDDIFTTGATTSAVCGVLRRVGAGKVAVWTLARGV
jgi:predicted amidophosphoribosyltransferase